MLALAVKTVHVLSAVLFLGTGLGSAWYKFRADRSGDLRVIDWCQREIVLADWIFTLPSGVVLPLSGLYLVHLFGLPFDTPWVLWGIGCYVTAGICWLPAAYLQIQMRRMTQQALADDTALPRAFGRANRIWLALGVPAFGASGLAIWVMVTKQPPF